MGNVIDMVIIPIYLIGMAINTLIITYIALFRKDYKIKILKISKLNFKDKTSFYFKKIPIIILILLFRILGSFFTTKEFINELSKAQKYSFSEIKRLIINSVIFLTIIPTLGLFIYLIDKIDILNTKEDSFLEISINMFTYMGYMFGFVIFITVLTIVILRIAKSFKNKGGE